DLERPGSLRARGRREGKAQEDDARGLDEELRGGARPDGDAAIALAAQADAVGRLVALLDFDRFARLEVVALDEPEELLVLVDDARHRHRRADGAAEQRLRLLLFHHALRIGN